MYKNQIIDRTIEEMKINSALRKRTIYFNEEVTSDSVFKLCYYLDRIIEVDKLAGITKENFKPINIVYTSYGGSVYDGLMAIGKIEQAMRMGYKIISTVEGYAMSMAQCMALVANKRQALKHSRIMMHQPSSGTWGKLKDMQEDVAETSELWEEMKRIITKYSNLTNDDLEEIKKSKTDKFMWDNEALKLGIIDEII